MRTLLFQLVLLLSITVVQLQLPQPPLVRNVHIHKVVGGIVSSSCRATSSKGRALKVSKALGKDPDKLIPLCTIAMRTFALSAIQTWVLAALGDIRQSCEPHELHIGTVEQVRPPDCEKALMVSVNNSRLDIRCLHEVCNRGFSGLAIPVRLAAICR